MKVLIIRVAFGPFAGLGLGTGVLKRAVLGLAMDHVFSELGFVAGVSYRRGEGSGGPRWRTGYVFGLSYTL
jgi:hypothetical protein